MGLYRKISEKTKTVGSGKGKGTTTEDATIHFQTRSIKGGDTMARYSMSEYIQALHHCKTEAEFMDVLNKAADDRKIDHLQFIQLHDLMEKRLAEREKEKSI